MAVIYEKERTRSWKGNTLGRTRNTERKVVGMGMTKIHYIRV